MTQEALKLALEALDNLMYWDNGKPDYDEAREAITAIKEALAQPDPYKQGYADAMNWKVQNHLEHLPTAQPEQEPVATVESVATVVSESGNQEVTMSWWHEPALPVGTKLYTTPPQRTWVGLTDEEYKELHLQMGPVYYYQEYGQAIEAKLKQKNGYTEEKNNPPQLEERNFCSRCGKRTKDIHTCTPPHE